MTVRRLPAGITDKALTTMTKSGPVPNAHSRNISLYPNTNDCKATIVPYILEATQAYVSQVIDELHSNIRGKLTSMKRTIFDNSGRLTTFHLALHVVDCRRMDRAKEPRYAYPKPGCQIVLATRFLAIR